MKPAPFRYVAVDTVEEAVAALAEHGEEAKLLAGGQSLVPLMNLRLAAPTVLVDVNRATGLAGVAANGVLEIGAATTQAVVEHSPEARAAAPLLALALAHVAHPGIRSRGTVGGSLAHADPAAELPAVLVALGGDVVVRGPGGERTIAAEDLFLGYFTTALGPGEVLTRIRIPRAGAGQRVGFQEVSRRAGDFALAGAAVAAEVDESGVCGWARVVLFGVGDRPLRAHAAEAALAGRRLDDAAARREAQAATSEGLDPRSDGQASAEYRREVAGVLVRRAIAEAAGASA